MENAVSSFRSGFVGLVGPTNSGKSTLLNALVGRKISIVSPKVQTTYHGVRGIVNTASEQVVFVDTPGFQSHSETVARLLNKVAESNAKDCDLLVWVFDASLPRVLAQVEKLADKIRKLKDDKGAVCVLNKVDKVAKPQLLPMIEQIARMELFSEIIPLSARTGVGLDNLRRVLWPALPPGQPLYPPDQVTDRSEDFRISEMIREKIYHATRQEIPYSTWIELEHWAPTDQKESKVPTIHAVIHVDSDSRRGILIGKGGEMLKRIGTTARADIEAMLGHQICLKLHVDVEKGWKEDANRLHQYLELE